MTDPRPDGLAARLAELLARIDAAREAGDPFVLDLHSRALIAAIGRALEDEEADREARRDRLV